MKLPDRKKISSFSGITHQAQLTSLAGLSMTEVQRLSQIDLRSEIAPLEQALCSSASLSVPRVMCVQEAAAAALSLGSQPGAMWCL